MPDQKNVPRKCKYCNMTIVFATNHAGKVVPVDVSSPTYRVYFHDSETTCVQIKGDQSNGTSLVECLIGVNHFATCSGVEKAKAAQKKRASRGAS